MPQVQDFQLYPRSKEVSAQMYIPVVDTIPTSSDDVDELPDGYDFRYDSYIFETSTEKIYWWNGTTFAAKEG